VILPPPGLELASPWMNAAGSMGFAPDSRLPFPHPMGAFVTNPISCKPRAPAENRTCIPYPGGCLLHTGLPNPGLRAVLRQAGVRWARADVPVWVHLLADSPAELAEMVRALEGLEGVAALEVGIAPTANGEDALALASAALGELPVVVQIPFDRADEPWLDRLAALGVSGLTLGAPRGSLPVPDGRLVSGRLLGPGLFPQVLAAVRSARRINLPLIAGAGLFQQAHAEAVLAAGAAAVQLDAVLWRGWMEG